ncbi:MAG: 4-hydroxythreonine-4-phosphate dehydrogenase PdxA [Crocinitomicaceae bacterium]|nr:4-hydroxythreonine-4-phosphate dehydrogenase PdxA [Crocinitomicaceae bacterium]|tara:strand:- start:5983 stop:7062 length:1080 start_codon:yes stop_codon:yes gene_type:complete
MVQKRHSGKKKIKVGVSIGDYNGVGLEVIIKSFLDSRMMEGCTPIVYGSTSLAKDYRKALNIQDFSFNFISDAAKANSKKVNLVTVWEEKNELTLGESTGDAGRCAFLSLEAATNDLASNKIDVLVTAPINKNNIQSDEFDFPGHTEYLADYANVETPLMILSAGDLRVGTITGHIPLKEVSENLYHDEIVTKIEIFEKSLKQDFRITKPRIAILGLNPHNGDNGTIGSEESEVIIPAVEEAMSKGILAFGPFPADGFFGSPAYKKFDGILSMYHDQGLTPFKALSFDEGVNFTAGLPIVRTSPDHGTGYDIAGKGIASETSFRNAVYLAIDIYNNRKDFKKLSESPLVTKKARTSKND